MVIEEADEFEDVGPWWCQTFGHDFELIEPHGKYRPEYDEKYRVGIAICKRCYHEFHAYEISYIIDGYWVTGWRYRPIEPSEEGTSNGADGTVDGPPEISECKVQKVT